MLKDYHDFLSNYAKKKMWPITALNYCKILRLFLFLIIILLPIQVILTFSVRKSHGLENLYGCVMRWKHYNVSMAPLFTFATLVSLKLADLLLVSSCLL